VGKFVRRIGLEKTVSSRRFIIPGYAAQISGELEESLPGWKVTVGPQEAADLEGIHEGAGRDSMTEVVFLPSGKSVKVMRGTRLLEAARGAGVEVDAPVVGKGSCGDASSGLLRGITNRTALGILPGTAVDEGYVLACRTAVHDSPLTVDVAEPAGRLAENSSRMKTGPGCPKELCFPEPPAERSAWQGKSSSRCRSLNVRRAFRPRAGLPRSAKRGRGRVAANPGNKGRRRRGRRVQKRETVWEDTVDASLRNGGGAGRNRSPPRCRSNACRRPPGGRGTVAVTLVHSSGCDRVVRLSCRGERLFGGCGQMFSPESLSFPSRRLYDAHCGLPDYCENDALYFGA